MKLDKTEIARWGAEWALARQQQAERREKIRQEAATMSVRELAAKYGLSTQRIHQIVKSDA